MRARVRRVRGEKKKKKNIVRHGATRKQPTPGSPLLQHVHDIGVRLSLAIVRSENCRKIDARAIFYILFRRLEHAAREYPLLLRSL